MQVRVRYFSQLKEAAGTATETIELADGATVSQLLTEVYRLHPDVEKWDRQVLVGAHLEFVGREHELAAGEEIALMPPVQGG